MKNWSDLCRKTTNQTSICGAFVSSTATAQNLHNSQTNTINAETMATYQDSYNVKILGRSRVVAAFKLELGKPIQGVDHLHLELSATVQQNYNLPAYF